MTSMSPTASTNTNILWRTALVLPLNCVLKLSRIVMYSCFPFSYVTMSYSRVSLSTAHRAE